MTSKAIHVRDFRKEVPGELSIDRMAWVFPTITTKTALDQTTNWKIYVRVIRHQDDVDDALSNNYVPIDDAFFDSKPMGVDLYGWIKVDFGIGDTIGKRVPTIVKTGKSLKTSAATNVFTQALRDAYGLYNKQLKKAVITPNDNDEADGVANTGNDVTKTDGITTELLPPMLAQTLASQTSPLVMNEDNPVFIQPKFNGVRAVTTLNCKEVDGVKSYDVIMYSRRKNLYHDFDYITSELKDRLVSFWERGIKLYLDGELYKHGVALQDISGHARREDKSNNIIVDYMVYDCFVSNQRELNSVERRKLLDEFFDCTAQNLIIDNQQTSMNQNNPTTCNTFTHTRVVDTDTVYTMDEINDLYKLFLSQGYEGAMVRVNSPYVFGFSERHSNVLLKMKPTHDAEYEIIGWETGKKGKAASALMIICTIDGKKFTVTPAMELPERIALAKKMSELEPNGKTHFENQWLGKKIIVYYDELSKNGIPQRARTELKIRTWD